MAHFVTGKKVLVTGATGFLGAHLARRLQDLGADLRLFRREESSLAQLGDLASEVDTTLGDIRDLDAVRRAVQGCALVFHVAGAISYWPGDREWLGAVNVGGTENVVEACLDANVQRLIHTSSIAALGVPPATTQGTEATPYEWGPYDFGYMSTKFLAETRVREAGDELDVVITNPGCIIGPGDWRHFGPLADLVRRGRLPGHPGGGTNFVSVSDVVEGHLCVAEKGTRGERYILGGENYSWREFMILMRRHFGRGNGFLLPEIPLYLLGQAMDLAGRLSGKAPQLTSEMVAISQLELYYSSDRACREVGYRWHPVGEQLYHALTWYEEHGFHAP